MKHKVKTKTKYKHTHTITPHPNPMVTPKPTQCKIYRGGTAELSQKGTASLAALM